MLIAALKELFRLWKEKINSLVDSTDVDSAGRSFTFTEIPPGNNSRSTNSGKRRAASNEPDNESSEEDKERPPSKKKRLSSGKSGNTGRR
jgi:hypothetical protein